MKVKHIIIIAVVAMSLVVIGALFKIMHWPGASLMLIFGLALIFISAILTIWKIFSNQKFKDILNS